MIGYRFLSPAEEEMTEAAISITLFRVDWEVISLMMSSRQLIGCVHPEAGAAIAPSLRRLLLHRFPFSIIYSIDSDVILVTAIAHHGRRPGYWQSRVDR